MTKVEQAAVDLLVNSNPEGINQYTNRGAMAKSKKAHEASQFAEGMSVKYSKDSYWARQALQTSTHAITSSDKREMAGAKKYHEEAAKLHGEIKDSETGLGRHELAAVHREAARLHTGALDYRRGLSSQ